MSLALLLSGLSLVVTTFCSLVALTREKSEDNSAENRLRAKKKKSLYAATVLGLIVGIVSLFVNDRNSKRANEASQRQIGALTTSVQSLANVNTTQFSQFQSQLIAYRDDISKSNATRRKAIVQRLNAQIVPGAGVSKDPREEWVRRARSAADQVWELQQKFEDARGAEWDRTGKLCERYGEPSCTNNLKPSRDFRVETQKTEMFSRYETEYEQEVIAVRTYLRHEAPGVVEPRVLASNGDYFVKNPGNALTLQAISQDLRLYADAVQSKIDRDKQ